jgi:hypothetical protein
MIDMPPENKKPTKEEEAGILGRCWGWFRAGVAAALAEKTIASPMVVPGTWMRQSPGRIRESLRRLVSDFVDVAEIPLMAASLYWSKLTDLDVQGDVSFGFGPLDCSLMDGTEPFEAVICPSAPVRPRFLRLDPRNAHLFTIHSIKVGETQQLISASSISGVFAVQGIMIGGQSIAGPGCNIVISVSYRPSTVSDKTLSGVIEGDLC